MNNYLDTDLLEQLFFCVPHLVKHLVECLQLVA